jgi:hypothetical protein
MKKLLILFSILFIINLVNAGIYNSCETYGNCASNKQLITTTNYSTANVNNSNYLQGYTVNTLYNYFNSLFDLVYQPIGNYLTNYNNIALTNQSNTFNGNLTAEYYSGQPINGMLGSGIIKINVTNNFAEVNISCSGLTCYYNNFEVRLVTTNLSTKYCKIPSGSKDVTAGYWNVLYVDNNCDVQVTDFDTYINTPISPGGIADFGNVMAYNGITELPNGLGLESKRVIKTRKVNLLGISTAHLTYYNGMDLQLNSFRHFNITAGQYVYLGDVPKTTKQNTIDNDIEVVSHSDASTWVHSDQSNGLNMTSCDTGTSTELCTNTNLYRQYHIFMIGYNDTLDYTEVHQLLASQTSTYTNIGDCIGTTESINLPLYYQHTARMLYTYCGRPSDSSWASTNFKDLRSNLQLTSSGGIDTSIFLNKDGSTPMTGNLNMSNNNITNVNIFSMNCQTNYNCNNVINNSFCCNSTGLYFKKG